MWMTKRIGADLCSASAPPEPSPVAGEGRVGGVQPSDEGEIRYMLVAAARGVICALPRASPHPELRADLPRKGGGEKSGSAK